MDDWRGGVYRGSFAGVRRRHIPRAVREKVLAAQKNRCLYCGQEFGAIVRNRWGKRIVVQLQWDHFVPYEYLRANPDLNWVAACASCNGAKSSLMFATVEAVKEYIRDLKPKRGRPKKTVTAPVVPTTPPVEQPDWHAWVYGGARNPALDLRVEKRAS